VETKGWPSEVWKLKWQIFEATYNHEHPEIELTIVK
jgi:hypothetical protein